MATASSELLIKAEAARVASRVLRTLPSEIKASGLYAIASALETNAKGLLEANAKDMASSVDAGLSASMNARLELTPATLEQMVKSVRVIADLPDPVGEVLEERTLPNGIKLARRRVPLGVIGAIFESRPEVPVDISALCVKSGNAVIMRGGKEATRTNQALCHLIRDAFSSVGITPEVVQMVESSDRALVGEMLRLNSHIDLLIPRGGAELIHFVSQEATMPTITGGIGVCHIYVDASASLEMAVDIILNAKVQAPAKCNALDTLLVHNTVAAELLSNLEMRLAEAGVEIRCDKRAFSLLGPNTHAHLVEASTSDWGQEFLDLILAVKVVDSIEEALDHIEVYGSGHTEAIVSEDQTVASRFLDAVDAAAVFVNVSTRFTDGGQFGLGAEVAISTSKFHARGPMGLRDLTSYKWLAVGEGQIRV